MCYYILGPGVPPIGVGPPGGWTPTPRPRPHGVCTLGVNILGPNYDQKLQTSSKRPKLIQIDQISLHKANITLFLGGGPSWAVILIEIKKVHILPIFLLSKVDLPPKCPKKNFYFIKLAILVKFGVYPVIFRLEYIILTYKHAEAKKRLFPHFLGPWEQIQPKLQK